MDDDNEEVVEEEWATANGVQEESEVSHLLRKTTKTHDSAKENAAPDTAEGVTPAFVREFCARYLKDLPPESWPTTRDVCTQIVRRATARLKMSMASAVARYGWEALDVPVDSFRTRWRRGTPPRRLRRIDSTDVLGRPFVAPPNTFISHAWSAPFDHLVEAICAVHDDDNDGEDDDGEDDDDDDDGIDDDAVEVPPHLITRYESPEPDLIMGWAEIDDKDDSTLTHSTPPTPPRLVRKQTRRRSPSVFWVDIFAVDQNAAAAEADELVNKGPPSSSDDSSWDVNFRRTIARIGRTRVLLSPFDAPVALYRAWCLFEMHTTVNLGGEIELHIARDDARRFVEQLTGGCFDLHAVLARIDVRSSGAYHESDRIRIVSRVDSDLANGGCDGMNQRLSALVRDWYLQRASDALNAVWPAHRYSGALAHNFACLLADAGIGSEAVSLASRCVHALTTCSPPPFMRAGRDAEIVATSVEDAGAADVALRPPSPPPCSPRFTREGGKQARIVLAAALGLTGRFDDAAAAAGAVMDSTSPREEAWWDALATVAAALSAFAHEKVRIASPVSAHTVASDACVVLEACRVSLAYICLRVRASRGEADTATLDARHDLANVLAALADVALVRGDDFERHARYALRYARAAREVHQDVLRRRLGSLGANHSDTQLSRANCGWAAEVEMRARETLSTSTTTM